MPYMVCVEDQLRMAAVPPFAHRYIQYTNHNFRDLPGVTINDDKTVCCGHFHAWAKPLPAAAARKALAELKLSETAAAGAENTDNAASGRGKAKGKSAASKKGEGAQDGARTQPAKAMASACPAYKSSAIIQPPGLYPKGESGQGKDGRVDFQLQGTNLGLLTSAKVRCVREAMSFEATNPTLQCVDDRRDRAMLTFESKFRVLSFEQGALSAMFAWSRALVPSSA